EAEAIIPRAAELGYEILDIRETGEVEMGTFNNATPIRFPDLKAKKLDLKGKKALLICHNGNRSSETCQALAEQGIDCRFIVGGLERWITEGRRAAGFYRQSILEARALPSYPNQRTLIDTPEARDLIEREHVAIIDVRYPGEFELNHLPGAVNIPLRRLTTAEIEGAFEKIPKGPAMAACYDRRSCFFSEIAGLILSRKGYDFRGRYTLPWEYAPKPPVPPQVAAALAERDMSTWARIERWFAGEIGKLAAVHGFLTVLLGLALLNRLLILPFALKAERDQMKALEIEPEIKALQQRLADDPSRRARALSQLYARHGMTPLRNLIALAALPMLMLASGALAKAAEAGNYELPLIGQLGSPDWTFLLPAASVALIGIYVDWALCRTLRQRLVAWLLALPALFAALALLPGAINLYVAVSAMLLLVQRATLVFSPLAALRRHFGRTPRSLAALGILNLADAAERPDVGNKAQRLGAMRRSGLPVPPGLVLTPDFVRRWQAAAAEDRGRLVRAVSRAAGRGLVAVRSSAAAEDLTGASHAGVYESVTNVAPSDLDAAIDRVIASFSSAKAGAYGGLDGEGSVIVQRMIEASASGVLFTRAPDAPGLALIERVEGAAEGSSQAGSPRNRSVSAGSRISRWSTRRHRPKPAVSSPWRAVSKACSERHRTSNGCRLGAGSSSCRAATSPPTRLELPPPCSPSGSARCRSPPRTRQVPHSRATKCAPCCPARRP
ncbi:MAG: YidC/Oxa1 family membrane protein insertase, partial [Proteobacteria bacterium]|nr:YidC/Oxa1 family membrane protein insertase [Pseudomonadota bacterium]